jgi:hypothetical protein
MTLREKGLEVVDRMRVALHPLFGHPNKIW